mmetsp:Transcript_29498/g.64977  ORF Transcript_29498/g.64977 Transcript_29498/m.64977 type:complete len:257 (+) Transcript_29498:465-1235(+)
MMNDPSLDNLCRDDTLFAIQPCAWFVNQVKLGRFSQAKGNGQTLHLTSTQAGNRKVLELIHFEGFENQKSKLTIRQRRIDFLFHQVLDASSKASELWVHTLYLVGYAMRGKAELPFVGFVTSSEHLHEGCLTSSVFSHQHDALGFFQRTRFYVECELGGANLAFSTVCHGWVLPYRHAIFASKTFRADDNFCSIVFCPHHVGMSHSKGQFVVSKAQILGGKVACQELVNTISHSTTTSDNTISARAPIETLHVIGH